MFWSEGSLTILNVSWGFLENLEDPIRGLKHYNSVYGGQLLRVFNMLIKNSRRFSTILEDSQGFSKILKDSRRFSRILEDSQGFMRIYEDLCGFMRIYEDLWGFLWIYGDLQGFMGIYGKRWAFLCFGFQRVLIEDSSVYQEILQNQWGVFKHRHRFSKTIRKSDKILGDCGGRGGGFLSNVLGNC